MMDPGERACPPRVARWLLARIVPAGPAREGLIGDLHELWLDRVRASGRVLGALWYWSEVLRAVARYSAPRLTRRGARAAGPRGHGPEALVRDIRYAVRTLGRSRGVTLTAILTLALGIGGTTAIFTVVDTVLVRPPPYREPGRLVNVWTTYPHWRGQESLDAFWDRIALSYPEYEDWRSGTRQFEATAAYTMGGATLTGRGPAERLTVGVGTASLLDVLGVRMALGRWFLPGEDVSGARLVVLTNGFWERRFGGDDGVVGTTVTLNDEPFEVIGVLPRGFALRNVFVTDDDGDHDAWLPLAVAGDLTARGNHAYDVIGRLAPGVTLASALAEATPLLRGDAPPERRGVRMAVREDVEVGALRSPLLLLLAASGVLLLIACGNVATMLLGESVKRRSEMATRAALGAGRGRIVRQLLTESVLLGMAGAAAGALVALLLTKLVVAFGPDLPVAREATFNLRALAFASALGLLTGVAFGVAPAATLRNVGLREAMQFGMRASSRRVRAFQDGVVALEIALTLILLVGGVLLTRTMTALLAVDPGFATHGIAVVDVSAATPGFTPERVTAMYAGAIPEMEAVPGVDRASGVSTLPLHGPSSSTSLDIEGRPPPTGDDPGPEAQRRVVFPAYHEVMGIPLLAGRLLTPADRADAPHAMVVSERFARTYWPGRSALGGRVRYDRRWWTVVGIVGDVRHGGLDVDPVATFYVPFAQNPTRSMTLIASVTSEPAAVLRPLQEAVRSADAGVVVTGLHTMDTLVSDAGATQRYRAIVLMLFAATAGLLALVGVFGVTARAVARRAPEMGVRLALGARVPSLTRMLVARSVAIGIAGTAIGLAASVWTTRLLAGFLFGVRPSDPASRLGVATFLLASVLAASWLAARRIAKLDPVQVLRAE